MNIISEYLSNNLSIIPINKRKGPLQAWKKYQYQRATTEDVLSWSDKYNDLNIGIVTGKISNIAVVDLDDLSLLPFVNEVIPEINNTTQVKTRRGYHFYFSLNGAVVKSTNKLFGEKLELKSNGNYVVAPDSLVNDHKYRFIRPLEEILPLPKVIIDYQNEIKEKERQKTNEKTIPLYRGKKVDCIRQILERELKEGERNISLFILYHLLVQNNNNKHYSRKIIKDLNNSLGKPLGIEEINNISVKTYKYSCIKIREMLPYISCTKCQNNFKGDGELKKSNILLRNIRKLHKISNTQRGILCLLGTTFKDNTPSISEIEKSCNMNYQTVRKALLELQKEGIIEEKIYK